jgi:Co/Zn/Cd efflux system component
MILRRRSAVHDLHIWLLSTTETALTCHLVMKEGPSGDTFLVEMAHQLKERFGIAHATIQNWPEGFFDLCRGGAASLLSY